MSYMLYAREINPRDLLSILQYESSDVLRIDYLSVIAIDREERQIWRRLLTSRRLYYNRIRWVYSYLTGQEPSVDQLPFNRPDSYHDGVAEQKQSDQQRQQKLHALSNQATDHVVVERLNELIERQQYEKNLIQQINEL
ncbi:hypothetical protein [Halalkalibacter sp. APA_J-10(15)]|uniref:hypothetical protein n=1 Tax=Halalkalibacter sp. APA_J-10(15) TaxID=2933805 RepID=UPI001FF683A9|nr:hypothetical protein [Halalkalibacter sp. APA_J-10(15)]MCK0472447.1 hypothetical protein [Halalkalibacter sp. APA_J-10(15)]